MHIQVNTDRNIDGHEALQARVESMVEQQLGRFFPRLTRIEVYLSDTNAGKGGANDKRCSVEARMENADPVAGTSEDETMETAIRNACNKVKAQLDAAVERQRPK